MKSVVLYVVDWRLYDIQGFYTFRYKPREQHSYKRLHPCVSMSFDIEQVRVAAIAPGHHQARTPETLLPSTFYTLFKLL